MAWTPKQESKSQILQEITREETPAPVKQANSKSKGQVAHPPSGPQWQVKGSPPTPFVNDFFLSHPDKVLGI